MCLIITRPGGVVLDKDKFLTAVDNNPDGWGFSVPTGTGYLTTIRNVEGHTDGEALYDLIHGEFADDPILLHLRYTTAGETILRNAHPFPILEMQADDVDLRMAHNGTISAFKPLTNSDRSWESDTRAYVRKVVRPMMKRVAALFGKDAIKDDFAMQIFDSQIPTTSVLAFIDGFGNFAYVNKDGNKGETDEDGTWFSNTYSFNPTHRSSTTTTATTVVDRTTIGRRDPTGLNGPKPGEQHWGSDYYDSGYFTHTGVWVRYDVEDAATQAERQAAVVDEGAKEDPMDDTRQLKFPAEFGEAYGVESVEDTYNFTDETISALVSEDPTAAESLIKTLLNHSYLLEFAARDAREEAKKANDIRQRAEGALYDANRRIESQTAWILRAKKEGYDGKAA